MIYYIHNMKACRNNQHDYTVLVPVQVMDDENESVKEMVGRGGSNLAGLQKVLV